MQGTELQRQVSWLDEAARSGEAIAAIVALLSQHLRFIGGQVLTPSFMPEYTPGQDVLRHRSTSRTQTRLHKRQLRRTCQTLQFAHEQ
jgi:hypothetical protein